jgi:cytochrome c
MSLAFITLGKGEHLVPSASKRASLIRAAICGAFIAGWLVSAGNTAAQTASVTSAPAAMTAEQGLALARAKACLGCHQVDKKRVGPSFTAIAQRRASQEDAVPYIVNVIRKGGRNQWGAVPMPGQPVNEQDAQSLAQWILSFRK